MFLEDDADSVIVERPRLKGGRERGSRGDRRFDTVFVFRAAEFEGEATRAATEEALVDFRGGEAPSVAVVGVFVLQTVMGVLLRGGDRQKGVPRWPAGAVRDCSGV